VRTCHLAALSEADASDVTLGERDAEGIDIRIQRIGAHSISGVVVDSAGAPADAAEVTAWPLDEYGTRAHSSTHATAFRLDGLTPGRYLLFARLGGSSPGDPNPPAREEERAYATVDLQAADATGIVLSASKATTVRGTLIFEGNPAPRNAERGIVVRMTPSAATSQVWEAQPPYAVVADNSTFELRGLYRRPLAVSVDGLPDGWALKSVLYGGRNITFTPTDFGIGPKPARLDVIVTNRVARPSIRVTDESGVPVATYNIVALHADSSRWVLGLRSIPGTPSADGHLPLGTLVPGDYLLAALPLADYLILARDHTQFERVRGIATRVTFGEGDARTIDLRLGRLPDKR
jgi:hypothetical protein